MSGMNLQGGDRSKKIIENCVIGDNVFVAAGTLVTKHIKSNSFVKGVPAKYERKKLAKF